ncbi:MAG: transcriptional activator NhaR [Desulfurivibrionaceae bacterium]|jgi:LysR family transcriptional activator of nhaA|nr:transcriptional activator NhaR [Desulfurivibrionaceae bacterium]PKN23225.1 MAG: transcriptional activator NhaR [Deltaproteobacteria bacterium HGW-Deltaproteobacteria-3]
MEWLNYHHLFYFWTVMREGSLTAASARLSLAPSTVSAQLGKLEESLGGKLFQRAGRNLEPTDLGRLVFRYADEIFSLGREMMDTIRGRPAAGPLSLKAGVVDVLPKLIVRRLLEPALQLPERVKLVCLEDKEDALLAELAMHSLDVVLSDAPLRAGLSVKAYSHLLGECGITFFAVEKLAGNLREKFPLSLHEAPMLLPMKMTALRGALERWFTTLSIRPAIAGEFDDSALLNVFGQEGDGVFVAPTVIEPEMLRQHKVQVVGRTQAVKERYYAISVERIIKHPAVAAILEAARHNLFMTK